MMMTVRIKMRGKEKRKKTKISEKCICNFYLSSSPTPKNCSKDEELKMFEAVRSDLIDEM